MLVKRFVSAKNQGAPFSIKKIEKSHSSEKPLLYFPAIKNVSLRETRTKVHREKLTHHGENSR